MGGTDIAVGGFTPLSSCDWPGELVATVFCQGCPLACRYCHNADLIAAGAGAGPDFGTILSFLGERRGLLDGVVFSGGEALIEPRLPEMIAAVKELGFCLALHLVSERPSPSQGRVPPSR